MTILKNIVFSPARFENKFMNIEVKRVTSAGAVKMLQAKDCLLIDVRTPKEWEMISFSPLVSKDVIYLSFTNPDMTVDSHFIDKFAKLGIDINTKILFVCRSGVRSGYAAESCAELGYECYNITDGIEALVFETKET